MNGVPGVLLETEGSSLILAKHFTLIPVTD